MTTNCFGKSFLSYRRSQAAFASLVIDALHDVGVPTWRDTDDLLSVVTSDALSMILSDQSMANGVLLISRDIDASDTILKIEAPKLMQRARANDPFFLTPVALDGLDYKEASRLLLGMPLYDDVANWNVLRIDDSHPTYSDALAIAKRVLISRLQKICAHTAPEQVVKILVNTVLPPAWVGDTSLSFDWHHRFDGRIPKDGAWEKLMPALRVAVQQLQLCLPNRTIEASGQLSIPAAVAFGSAFLTTSGVRLIWTQHSALGPQRWSLNNATGVHAFPTSLEQLDITSDALAVLVCVTNDVEAAMSSSRATLPSFRAKLKVSAGPSLTQSLDAEQAATLAVHIRDQIRQTLAQCAPIRSVHLFVAGPADWQF